MAANTAYVRQDAGRLFFSRRLGRERFAITALAVVVSIIFLWPFFVVVANTFNSINAYMNPLLPWPKEFSMKAYELAFTKYKFQNYMVNTILVVAATSTLGTLSCALAGYALAKLQFAGRGIFFAIILAVMLLPTETMLVPQFVVVRDLGMVNTFWGVILPGLAGGAFGIFLMRQFMLQIPTEMLEAGRIDGCSEFGLFTRIAMPLMKAPILVLAILSVRTGWNSLLWPQIVLSEETKQLLMPAIVRVRSLTVADPHALVISSGVAILGALIPLAFYMYAQRFFVSTLTGAIKG